MIESTFSESRTLVECIKCGSVHYSAFETNCRFDGWPLRVNPVSIANERPGHASFGKRFRDVLPLRDLNACRETESFKTPLLDSPVLAKRLGVGKLFLKNECELPTGTTKDRMAAGSLAYMLDNGVSDFVVVSTGNSTSAMTRLLSKYPELHMHAFAGKGFVGRHRLRDMENVSFHAVGGDFVSAGKQAKVFANKKGFVWEGGFFNPVRRISLATAYLEACDDLGDAPHFYVQSVSSAMGLVGVGELASAQMAQGSITRLPRLVGVQQSSCCPMVKAFREDCDEIHRHHVVKNPKGIAKAILRGDPTASYPLVRQHVLSSGGSLESVKNRDIYEARELLKRAHHVVVGFAAAAAFAAVLKMGRQKRFRPDEIVLVNLTGKY